MSRQPNQNFNLQFVKDIMLQWTNAAVNYEREAEKAYTKLRSYLTLYQFRLDDNQKHDIREMLSQSLDDIEKMNLIEDMDNYLDGFCFKIDPSVLPAISKPKPTSVKIEIAPSQSIQEQQNERQKHQRHPQYLTQQSPQPLKKHNITETQTRQPQIHDHNEPDQEMLDTFAPISFNENAVDFTDFYQLQFLQ